MEFRATGYGATEHDARLDALAQIERQMTSARQDAEVQALGASAGVMLVLGPLVLGWALLLQLLRRPIPAMLTGALWLTLLAILLEVGKTVIGVDRGPNLAWIVMIPAGLGALFFTCMWMAQTTPKLVGLLSQLEFMAHIWIYRRSSILGRMVHIALVFLPTGVFAAGFGPEIAAGAVPPTEAILFFAIWQATVLYAYRVNHPTAQYLTLFGALKTAHAPQGETLADEDEASAAR